MNEPPKRLFMKKLLEIWIVMTQSTYRWSDCNYVNPRVGSEVNIDEVQCVLGPVNILLVSSTVCLIIVKPYYGLCNLRRSGKEKIMQKNYKTIIHQCCASITVQLH